MWKPCLDIGRFLDEATRLVQGYSYTRRYRACRPKPLSADYLQVDTFEEDGLDGEEFGEWEETKKDSDDEDGPRIELTKL